MADSPRRPHVVLVAGYYDIFSSYQEVVLAREFAKTCRVTVVTGDRASPAFTDNTLATLGVSRFYPVGLSHDGDVRVIRVPYRKVSSLLIPRGIRRQLRDLAPDLVLVLAVGQGFSAPAAHGFASVPKVAIFGDNTAQWAGLGRVALTVRRLAFGTTKGLLYRDVIGRCDRVYGNTPQTLERIAPYAGSVQRSLLPLAVEPAIFHADEVDRAERRRLWDVGNARVVGVVGKLAQEKEVERVLEALEALPTDVPWRLVVGGFTQDPYAQALRSRIASSPLLSERAICLGYLSAEDIASVLRACDVCVWPVQPAITIQQAMLSGTRVVIPDNDLVGFLTDVTGHGRAFAVGNQMALRDAIAAEVLAEDSAESRAWRATMSDPLSAAGACRRILTESGLV